MLRAEIHSLSVLSPSSKAYQDHMFIESKIGNYFPIEYIVNEEKIERSKISKWVNTVYNMDEVFSLLEEINYDTVDRIQFDGKNIWVPAKK